MDLPDDLAMASAEKTVNAEVLPLGCNCHLGAALAGYGHHDSSLLRWAALPIERLLDLVEGGDRLFHGTLLFRFAGTNFGDLDYAAMREKLGAAAPEAHINTVIRTRGGRWHGVQLRADDKALLSLDQIHAANAEKRAHLEAKWRATLS